MVHLPVWVTRRFRGSTTGASWRRGSCAAATPTRSTWVTPEGIPVKPLYTAADLEALETVGGLPGFEPFVRGPRATMYANRPWTIRQYAGFSTAEESNAFYRQNLAAGQMGLSVAFDLATHRGYDSDHPGVVGDVGKAGVAIDSVEDMKLLFDGIPLDKMSVSMTMNGAVLPVLAGYVGRGGGAGRRPEQAQRDHPERHPQRVHGPQHLHLPARAEHADRGRHHPVHVAAHAASSTRSRSPATTCKRPARPRCRNSASRSPTVWSTRGTATGARLGVDEFAGRLSFFFAIGMNFFMEVAKLRAARLLWARIMNDLGAKKPGSKMLRTHCQTSGVSLTEQDPYNNIVRTAYEALAAVLGGTQSLHTNSFDEAIALPSDFAARIARNTQLDPRRGDRRHPRDRSARRLVLRRGADAEPRRRGVEADPGGRAARRHDQGRRVGHAEAAHRGGGGPPPGSGRPRRRDDRRRQQVPARRRTPIDTRDIDNAEVRRQQLERLGARQGRARSRARAGRARRAHRGRGGRREPARALDRGVARARRPSARSPTRWRRCSAATAP